MAEAFEGVGIFHSPTADPRVAVRGVTVPPNQVFDGVIGACACVKDATHYVFGVCARIYKGRVEEVCP